MTCTSCKTKIEGLLSAVTGVKKVEIDFPNKTADIEMGSGMWSLNIFQLLHIMIVIWVLGQGSPSLTKII